MEYALFLVLSMASNGELEHAHVLGMMEKNECELNLKSISPPTDRAIAEKHGISVLHGRCLYLSNYDIRKLREAVLKAMPETPSK